MNVLTVDRDSEQVAKFFKLATGQLQRTKIPQHEVIVSSIRLKLVAKRNQFFGQGTSVGDHLLGVGLPGGLAGLEQSGSDAGDSLGRKVLSDNCFTERKKTDVVVGAALACREHGIIYPFFKVGCLLGILPEED
jgi:hypothetical protein